MSQAAKVQEPSIEEILASIRRIIADDDAGKGAKTSESTPSQSPASPPAPATPASPPAAANPASPPAAANPASPSPSATGNSQYIDAKLADGDKPQTAPKTEPPEAASKPADVLSLTEAMATETPAASDKHPAPTFRAIDAGSDLTFADRRPKPLIEPVVRPAREAPQQVSPRIPPSVAPPAPSPALLSKAATAAVDKAFNSLAHTVLGQNARTLEDLVKEMLRPLLKSWLDDNLPGLVERIVRSEIERVSRGRT